MGANDSPYIIGFPYQNYGLDLQQGADGKGYLAPTVPQVQAFDYGSKVPARSQVMGNPPKPQASKPAFQQQMLAATQRPPSGGSDPLTAYKNLFGGNPNTQTPAASAPPPQPKPKMSDADAAKLMARGDAVQSQAMASVQGQTAPQQMMNATEPYAYKYRPGIGHDPQQQQYGVMAQDLEKTPMGASVVRDTPMGKVIDVPKATGVQFAALSDLQDQINRLRGGPTAVQPALERARKADEDGH